MVVRSPFLLGISTETVVDRFQELQRELAGADVQRMAEYCPSILEVFLTEHAMQIVYTPSYL